MTTPKSAYMGQTVSFYEPPPKKTGLCMYSLDGCTRFTGQVVAVHDKEPIGPGKVPDQWLDVAGASGAIKRVSVVLNEVKFIADQIKGKK